MSILVSRLPQLPPVEKYEVNNINRPVPTGLGGCAWLCPGMCIPGFRESAFHDLIPPDVVLVEGNRGNLRVNGDSGGGFSIQHRSDLGDEKVSNFGSSADLNQVLVQLLEEVSPPFDPFYVPTVPEMVEILYWCRARRAARRVFWVVLVGALSQGKDLMYVFNVCGAFGVMPA